MAKKWNPLADQEAVAKYMAALKHPLKAEIEALRKIIRGADKRIGERVKWNAPSYYYKNDMVTFNPRATEHVHLVFHHPAIDSMKSPLFKGDFKGRKMMYLSNMKEVNEAKKEITRIMHELTALDDAKATKS